MDKKSFELPLIALRGMVAYPNTTFSFDLSRFKSIEALENAMINNQTVFLTAQKDASEDDFNENNIFYTGTIVKVKQLLRMPGNLIRVLAEGEKRAAISDFLQKKPFFIAQVMEKGDYSNDITEAEGNALLNMMHEAFEKYSSLYKRIQPDFIMEVLSSESIEYLSNLLASKINFKLKDKQSILEEDSVRKRTIMVIKLINREIEFLTIQKEIDLKVKQKIDKSQKEYYLKEQLKVIQEELGEKEGISAEISEYEQRAEKIPMPDYVKDKFNKEIKRLKKMSYSSSESSVSRDYIELLLELPWNKATKENKNLKRAQQILDKEHFGLEKVKERVIEFLAVRHNTDNINAPVLCLSGPPGVGKTSIAKSIARALNRKYVRISLGGVRDEAEIRGHRKTYVGAMPGRIITALKQSESGNPLILLDEVDKISSDYKGDPSSALLEVLDGEQNFSFRDNYLELPFDLSNVLFICTANDLSTVPKALIDRFEIIEISSYTEEEKFNITDKFLLDKQIKKHGLKKSNLKIRKEAIFDIITYYTRESGVRQLERLISTLCRKAVKAILLNGENGIIVKTDNISEFLGKRKYLYNKINDKNEIGIVRGLAWTSAGGDTLSVEVNTMKGKGNFKLTGNVGKVMEESASAAISFIRANCDYLKIRENFYEDTDIHIHIPEGAVPKDGPSAGITMACAMISALKKVPVRNDVAMTGEITLRGKVLPIGGLKEKVLAAKRAGIKKIIIPFENARDLEDLPDYVKMEIEFVLAETMEDVISNCLAEEGLNVINNDRNDDNIIINKIEDDKMKTFIRD